MKKLSIILSLLCTTSLYAKIIFSNPYSNKVYTWDGANIENINDEEEVFFTNPSLKLSAFGQNPIAISKDTFLLTTTDGKIISLNVDSGSSTVMFASKDKCRASLAYSGCIYSMTMKADKSVYFLLHQEDGSDNLMEMKDGVVKLVVKNVPGPSGPTWVKPNGNIGILPYGVGIAELEIPKISWQYADDVTMSFYEVETMAGKVFEAGNGTIGVFDFSNFKTFNRDNKDFSVVEAVADIYYDSCAGRVWGITSDEDLESTFFDDDRVPTYPANAASCPLIVDWELVKKTGISGSSVDKLSSIQGYPSGTARVPSMQVFSIGSGNELIVKPRNKKIVNSQGVDLRIFENPFVFIKGGKPNVYAEPASVELYNGTKWVSTGCDCSNPTKDKCAGMQPTRSKLGNGITPWSNKAGGFPIDIEELGISEVKQVKIKDCSTNASGTSGIYSGFDLDAIIVTPNSIK